MFDMSIGSAIVFVGCVWGVVALSGLAVAVWLVKREG